MPRPRAVLVSALLPLVLLAGVTAVAAVHQAHVGDAALAQAAAAKARGDLRDELLWLHAAAETRTPLGHASERAAEGLTELAAEAESSRDPLVHPLAAQARTALRTSARETHLALFPSSRASLSGAPDGRGAPTSRPLPSLASYLAVGLAFFLFVASVLRLVWVGVPPIGRAPRAYVFPALGVVAFVLALAFS